MTSEIDGGVFLKDLAVGTTLRVQTQSRAYVIDKVAENDYLLSGHPKYCPEPTKAYIHGSTFGGSLIKVGFVGQDMRLEFHTDEHPGRITTTRVVDIKEMQ